MTKRQLDQLYANLRMYGHASFNDIRTLRGIGGARPQHEMALELLLRLMRKELKCHRNHSKGTNEEQ